MTFVKLMSWLVGGFASWYYSQFLASCRVCTVTLIFYGLQNGQPRPKVKILLNRLPFLLLWLLTDVLKFSEELLLAELASEDVRLRGLLKLAAPTMSSRRTSESGEVVW